MMDLVGNFLGRYRLFVVVVHAMSGTLMNPENNYRSWLDTLLVLGFPVSSLYFLSVYLPNSKGNLNLYAYLEI